MTTSLQNDNVSLVKDCSPDPDDSDVPVGEGGDTGGDRGGDDGDESPDSPESGELGDSLEFSSTTTGSLSSEEPPDPSELVGEVAPPSTPGERGLRLPARPNLGCWGWPEVPEAPSVGAMTLPLMAVGVNANIVSLEEKQQCFHFFYFLG